MYKNVQTKFVYVGGFKFAYRELGLQTGVPVVLLNHWGAVLDNFDPYIVDVLAGSHRVIAVDYRGIGASSGSAPLKVGDMSEDIINFIKVLGFNKVDLFGFSLGGMVAQDIAIKKQGLVRKLVLAGTGPAGGIGINKVGYVSWPLIVKGLLTFRDPKFYLFFTSSQNSRRAAKEFIERLKLRKTNRDKGPTPRAFLRQLKAIHGWGSQPPQDLSKINIPTLVVNGDSDVMVPTENTVNIAKHINGAQLIIYKDAGHGGIFQYRKEFSKALLEFLVK